MRTAGSFTIVLIAAAWFAGGAEARCLRYEPAQVSLVGELTTKKVPGPPGYTSLARGDLPETIHLIVLEASICVTGNPASAQNSRSHSDVTEVQLVTESRRLRSLVGKRVRATGTLSAAQTGHHRTPVILAVKSLRAADSPAEAPPPGDG